MTSALRPIEIVGGGLAGLALGLALRRHHVPVTVIEAGSYPRHRVCGEFITGLSPATEQTLGLGDVLADARQHHDMAWYRQETRIQTHRLPRPARALSRHTLDARLARAFVVAGGELRERTRMHDHAAPPGRILAHGRRPRLESPWLGLKLHVVGLELRHGLEVHLGRDAYVGLTPVEDGRVNVCGLFRRRPVRARGLEVVFGYLETSGLAALARRLRAADPDPASFCAVAALAFQRGVISRQELCIGDAAAMIPPFTGNGMAMAFQSAEAALGPVLRYCTGQLDWREACAATQAALRGRFRLRLASASTLHPFLLRSRRQRCFAALAQVGLLPFRPLYAVLH